MVQLFEIMETPEAIFMVMEYASGGELFDYIVENGKVNTRKELWLSGVILGFPSRGSWFEYLLCLFLLQNFQA